MCPFDVYSLPDESELNMIWMRPTISQGSFSNLNGIEINRWVSAQRCLAEPLHGLLQAQPSGEYARGEPPFLWWDVGTL